MCGCQYNVLNTTMIDYIPLSRRTEGISVYALNYTFGLAIGPALTMIVAAKWSYTPVFVILLFSAVMSATCIFQIRFKKTEFAEESIPQQDGKQSFLGVFEKTALPMAFMILPLSLCYAGAQTFIETYTKGLDIAWTAQGFFIGYSLLIVLTRPLAGRLADQRGENYVMVPVIIVNAVGCAALGLAGIVPPAAAALVIASALLMAVGFGSVLPLGHAVAIKYGQPHQFARITSTYWVFSDCAMGFGGFLLGHIASGIGFSNLFFVEVAFSFVGLIIYWRLHGRRQR